METPKKWLTFLFVSLQLLGFDRQVLLVENRLATRALLSVLFTASVFRDHFLKTGAINAGSWPSAVVAMMALHNKKKRLIIELSLLHVSYPLPVDSTRTLRRPLIPCPHHQLN
jgi:hypothetical protein